MLPWLGFFQVRKLLRSFLDASMKFHMGLGSECNLSTSTKPNHLYTVIILKSDCEISNVENWLFGDVLGYRGCGDCNKPL